jgi:hypothetical protein
MKMHTKRFSAGALLALISALPLVSLAGNGDLIEKKKTISKSYSVTSSDKLSIENSFGNVVVTTWDKNEMKVDIEIGVKANTEERAQNMLDEIEVIDNQSTNLISFKTDVGDANQNGHNKHKNGDYNDDRKFYIDYKIYMPAANPLDLENSFGKTTVPDLSGETSLTSKFGSLTAGKLSNVDDIDVEFGTADIGPIHNGNVTFKFSSRSHIADVSGTVKIKSEFSGDVEFGVNNNIDELSLFESYSDIKMLVSKGLSAHFNVHTSFSSFHNGTNFNIAEEKDDDEQMGPRFDKDFSGNSGDGKAKIKIKSSFGKVRLSDSSDKSSSNFESDDKVEESKS